MQPRPGKVTQAPTTQGLAAARFPEALPGMMVPSPSHPALEEPKNSSSFLWVVSARGSLILFDEFMSL